MGIRVLSGCRPQVESVETALKWPEASAIGAAGVALVKAKLLQHEILPCAPELDIGFDLVTVFNTVLNRVQVKATQCADRNSVDSITFCVKRRKTGMSRSGQYLAAAAQPYSRAMFDAFVFVHNVQQRFFIVPANAIDLNRHKISFTPESRWADAWWVLKKPQ
jgi:hypothetical protein